MKIVSEKALVQRMNRRLRRDGLRVLVMPVREVRHGWLGRYCLVSKQNTLENPDVDLVGLARELRLIKSNEALMGA